MHEKICAILCLTVVSIFAKYVFVKLWSGPMRWGAPRWGTIAEPFWTESILYWVRVTGGCAYKSFLKKKEEQNSNETKMLQP